MLTSSLLSISSCGPTSVLTPTRKDEHWMLRAAYLEGRPRELEELGIDLWIKRSPASLAVCLTDHKKQSMNFELKLINFIDIIIV